MSKSEVPVLERWDGFYRKYRIFLYILLGIVLLILPVLFPKNYIMGVLCRILMYSTLAGALNSLNGYSGETRYRRIFLHRSLYGGCTGNEASPQFLAFASCFRYRYGIDWLAHCFTDFEDERNLSFYRYLRVFGDCKTHCIELDRRYRRGARD